MSGDVCPVTMCTEHHFNLNIEICHTDEIKARLCAQVWSKLRHDMGEQTQTQTQTYLVSEKCQGT